MNKERDEISTQMNGLEKIDKLIQKEKGVETSDQVYKSINLLVADAENTYRALCELEEEPPIIENLEDIKVKVQSDYNMWRGNLELETC